MSSEHDIAIISVGYRDSPFTKEILQNDIIPYSIIANNSSDFQIHHADPSKILFYSLEFTKIIEIIAKKSMDSLAVFETLGQFFEFYNPLHLSTLNYLISKYATSIKPKNKEYMQAWKNITTTIFDSEFIYPLFEESRIFHIKEGEVEIPVRQFLISSELEKKKENSKNNNKALNQVLEDITGIIDLEENSKMKISSSAVKKITSASAVIIIPTDIVSLFILFNSNHFKETLQKSDGEIAIISPFWPGNEINKIEKTILQKTNFEANLVNVAKLVKDCVDAVIIDTKDSDLVPSLREEGVTVLVEDLSPENQSTQEFLDTVLKSIEISLDTIAIEPQGLIEGLGEKLVSLFRVREPKQEKEEVKTLEISIKEEDLELIESIFEEGISEDEPKKMETEIFEDLPESDTLTDEFEMEVIDTEEPIQTIPTTPPKDASIDSEFYNPEAEGQFVLPGIEQITQFELEELDSLDVDEHIITSFIERAMTSNATGVEVVFSDLLSLQNNPLLIDKIYQTILKRLIKVRELNPEEKIADMITYLSAHKPEYYHEKLNTLLEDTLNSEEEKVFYQNLKTTSLVVRSSLLIAGDVIEKFMQKNIDTSDAYVEDRLKRMVSAFGVASVDLLQLLCRILVNIYKQELEKEESDETITQRIISFLTMFDGLSVAISLVTLGSEATVESITNAINEMALNNSFKKIITDVLAVFNEGSYEDLVKAFQGRILPENVEFEMMKKKYITSLSKVGSIPLELFAERIGLSVDKAEKMIYDMILQEEIPARIELVSGRLYIVQDIDEAEEITEGLVKEITRETKETHEKTDEEVEHLDQKEVTETLEEHPEQMRTEEILEKEFACTQCQKSFKTERGLKMHVSRVHKK
ncbi:MAG: PCI domain-containing protein [Candidatus Heimdallarchaeaceae archaeon]